MTKDEIDKTIDFLIEAKKDGQFRAFWKTFDESVNLMASGEVVIQSMWSPAVAAVRSKGIPCKYQPLKEGYRAWGGGLGLAKHLTGAQLDAAYEYINWYLSGWVGAYLNRQGYYSAVLDTAKEFMSADEWGFWMEGKPAQADILSPEGKVMEKAGAVRDGGSFQERMGSVACWNAVMDEDRYMVSKRWNEFIARLGSVARFLLDISRCRSGRSAARSGALLTRNPETSGSLPNHSLGVPVSLCSPGTTGGLIGQELMTDSVVTQRSPGRRSRKRRRRSRGRSGAPRRPRALSAGDAACRHPRRLPDRAHRHHRHGELLGLRFRPHHTPTSS